MNDNNETDDAKNLTEQCPKCSGEIYSHGYVSGVGWCDECEREYWQEEGRGLVVELMATFGLLTAEEMEE